MIETGTISTRIEDVTRAGNSKDTGDLTELKIIEVLIANDYQVAIPFGDNSKYDLIVDAGGSLHRIQCKTAWRTKRGTIRFNTHSQTTSDGEYFEETYSGAIEAFIARFPPDERLFWVPIEDAQGHQIHLRDKAEIDHPSINWAADYEFDGRIPG